MFIAQASIAFYVLFHAAVRECDKEFPVLQNRRSIFSDQSIFRGVFCSDSVLSLVFEGGDWKLQQEIKALSGKGKLIIFFNPYATGTMCKISVSNYEEQRLSQRYLHKSRDRRILFRGHLADRRFIYVQLCDDASGTKSERR